MRCSDINRLILSALNPGSRIFAGQQQAERHQFARRTATMEAQLSSVEVRVSRLRRVTLAAQSFPRLFAPVPRCSRPGRQARRAEGAPLTPVEKLSQVRLGTALDTAPAPSLRFRSYSHSLARRRPKCSAADEF